MWWIDREPKEEPARGTRKTYTKEFGGIPFPAILRLLLLAFLLALLWVKKAIGPKDRSIAGGVGCFAECRRMFQQ